MLGGRCEAGWRGASAWEARSWVWLRTGWLSHPPGLTGTLFIQLIQLNDAHYMARFSLSCEAGNETSPSPRLLSSGSAPSPGPCSLQCWAAPSAWCSTNRPQAGQPHQCAALNSPSTGPALPPAPTGLISSEPHSSPLLSLSLACPPTLNFEPQLLIGPQI